MKIRLLMLCLFAFLPLISMDQKSMPVLCVGPAYHVRKQLNDDFYANANINGMVSYIYYPYSKAKEGYVELEIEGTCRNMVSDSGESLESRITRSTTPSVAKPGKMKGRFFKRYSITVSPKELNNLKNDLQAMLSRSSCSDAIYETCSYKVLSLLAKNTRFNVSVPFTIAPSLAALYIYVRQPSSLKDVTEYGKRLNYKGEMFECMRMGLPIIYVLLFPIIIAAVISSENNR